VEQFRSQEQNRDKKISKNDPAGVRAVERAVDILLCLGNSGLNLSEISKEVNLSKTTVYRMLVSLERKGFVTKSESTGKYFLGWGILELLSDTLSRSQSLVQSATPYMEKLWQHTSETICLYIQNSFSRLCIAEIPSPHPLKYTVGIGVSVPLHAGAPGKLLLAYLPAPEQVEALKHTDFRPLTDKTITGEKQLLQELKIIRERGWATSYGERIEGVSCLAVPIVDRKTRVVASLSILGPYIRLQEEHLMGYLHVLQKAARGISSRLGILDA
jgi:DNA-binding IclR family transcriptional regulator